MYFPERAWGYRDAETAALALLTPRTVDSAKYLAAQGILGQLMFALFPEARLLASPDLNERLDRRMRDTNLLGASRTAERDFWPVRSRTELNIPAAYVPARVRDSMRRMNVLTVGAGAGSLVNLAYLAAMGVPKGAVTMVDRYGRVGGMWAKDPEGQAAKFNNPYLAAQFEELNPAYGRTNEQMMSFLRALGRPYHDRIVRGEVERLEKVGHGRVAIINGEKRVGPKEGAAITLVALGNHPLPIRSGKMETNAEQFERAIERCQRPLTEQEARELDGQKIVIVGLGNSALAQIGFIQDAMRRYDVKIGVVLLTHFTSRGINNPDAYCLRADGTRDRLSRDLADGITVNLELDLPESRELFERFRESSTFWMNGESGRDDLGGIVPSVRAWKVGREGDSFKLNVVVSEEHERGRGGEYQIANVGKIFALTGYGVPPDLLNNMGVSTEGGRALVRPHDGAAMDENGGVDPSLVVAGFAATDQAKTPSGGTIPGMLGSAPYKLFSLALLAESWRTQGLVKV